MRSLRTVVVDDDFAVADVHGRYVDAHRHCVTVAKAHSGKAGLEAVERHKPDLVLLDLYLPDVHGLQVLARLRALALTPAPEVVVVTAARDLESVRAARNNGVFHYIAKPFTMRDLHGRLDEVVQGLRTVRALHTTSEPMKQHELDTVISGGRMPRTASDLPKGLSGTTLSLIESTLAELGGDHSASEVATAAGMSRVSARRYLEHLVRAERADAAPQYGQAGRPEIRYRWTGQA